MNRLKIKFCDTPEGVICFSIKDSAKLWTLIAETLKKAADEHNNDCLNKVDLSKLQEHVLLILDKEEMMFKNLLKLKV